MLHMQGHEVSGISLEPLEKSLFHDANLQQIFVHDLRLDIRDYDSILKVLPVINPEVIIHLAAQPLVIESIKKPIETFDTNVMGTLNILEATKILRRLKATLIITTDKVYKNQKLLRGYVETDELGGDDPYSASKSSADIATQSWVKNYATSPVAIARAGNVIGGGDWAPHRIIPDLVSAYSQEKAPLLRNPDAIRPWQHVLDCLMGYIQLIEYQIGFQDSSQWNFGPNPNEAHNVRELVEKFGTYWGVRENFWVQDTSQHIVETSSLLLDSTKARRLLNWNDRLNFDEAVGWTVDWYKSLGSSSVIAQTKDQIKRYFEIGI